MRTFRPRARILGGGNPGKGVIRGISELRGQRLPYRLGWATLLGLLLIMAWASSGVSGKLADNYQEMFDIDLFNERVQLINTVSRGDTEAEVLKKLGKPQIQQVSPDNNSKIFIYRVRCYMGPEPLSNWPRHLSATYAARFIFDSQGRVSDIKTDP